MSDADLSEYPMLLHINELADQLGGYTRGTMVEWTVVRDHFKRERQRRGLTQKAVAIQGAVDQGAISKLEADEHYMPSVMTFIGAIHGLGYPQPSEFFREIEQLKTVSGSAKRQVFVAHHAAESDPVSATAAALPGGGGGPAPFDSFRDALRNFLVNLQVVAAELERAEAAAHPVAPPRRGRRSARPARHR